MLINGTKITRMWSELMFAFNFIIIVIIRIKGDTVKQHNRRTTIRQRYGLKLNLLKCLSGCTRHINMDVFCHMFSACGHVFGTNWTSFREAGMKDSLKVRSEPEQHKECVHLSRRCNKWAASEELRNRGSSESLVVWNRGLNQLKRVKEPVHILQVISERLGLQQPPAALQTPSS